MKTSKVTRRRFILGGLLLSPCALLAHARWIEPDWLKIRRLHLAKEKPTHRFVHFTDLHHKGDRTYCESVVKIINSLSPDFVCFTGDIIEDGEHLPEALEILSGIKSPLYGVPGNHDYWSKVKFDGIAECFEATGGSWLLDKQVQTPDGKVNIIGASCVSATQQPLPPQPGVKNVFLMHYPAWVKKLGDLKYDVLLAGHSHGGQVRIPIYGPIVVPFGCDEFDLGLFQTQCGPLYVGAGIGWFLWPVRFRCRPEITVIEI